MPALDRYAKVACYNCGTPNKTWQNTKRNIQLGHYIALPNFSVLSQNDLNYYIAKKHGALKPAVAHICMICKDRFTGIYAVRQHKSQMHGQTFETKGDSSPIL